MADEGVMMDENDEKNLVKSWERLEECLQYSDKKTFLQKLVNNAGIISSLMECDNIISESTDLFKNMTILNKKISMSTHSRSVDNTLVYIFLKMLTTIPQNTEAFKLGLIDSNGKLIRSPKTKEEEDSISNLDLLMFKIRQWLMPKMSYLSPVLWIRGVNNGVRLQNYFSNVETTSRQYCIRKINDELWKILKKA